MTTSIEDRLSLAAAKSPRSESSALMLEAAHTIVEIREWASLYDYAHCVSISAVGEHARDAGFYRGTLMMIASGRVDGPRVAKAALEARGDD
jgi:hypothetical protein